jgi:hypothetical protein
MKGKMLRISVPILLSLVIVRALTAQTMTSTVQKTLGIDYPAAHLESKMVVVGETLLHAIPVEGWIKPRITYALYDRSFKKILKEGVLDRASHSKAVSDTVAMTIDSAGLYVAFYKIDGVGRDDGMRHRYGFFSEVTARWPLVPMQPDPKYYFGERNTFSFAAGHKDYSGYSFDILKASKVVLTGKGPVISIGDLSLNSSGLGDFEVRGYYRGAEFKYVDSVGGPVRRSEWTINVSPPEHREFKSHWLDLADPAGGSVPLLDLSSESAFMKPCDFHFAAWGYFYSGIYLISSRITSVDVESTPAAFLPPERSKRYNRSEKGLWSVIEVRPSPVFVNQRSRDYPSEVTLKFTITDEFEVTWSKTVRAKVYCSSPLPE